MNKVEVIRWISPLISNIVDLESQVRRAVTQLERSWRICLTVGIHHIRLYRRQISSDYRCIRILVGKINCPDPCARPNI